LSIERHRRILTNQAPQFLAEVGVPTVIDCNQIETDLLAVARTHNLTVYDASYLELAARLALPLCTLDKQLIEATPKMGVALWQP
jgi:predicted nucleic acid-binding protein